MGRLHLLHSGVKVKYLLVSSHGCSVEDFLRPYNGQCTRLRHTTRITDIFYMMHTLSGPSQNRVYPDQVTNKRPTQPYYCTTYTVGFTLAYSIHQTQLTIINWGYSLHCTQYYLLTLYLQAHRHTAGRGREGQNTLQSAGFRTPHLPSFFRARGMWYNPHSESVRSGYVP